ncbi:MAG: hypothetical protein Q9165_000945 [Trypethelium subeluteriae]
MALRVAIEGCGHGTLHAIYASVEQSCKSKGWDGVDCLIIGGDFQVRESKYRELGDFHEYYSGAREAPYLTIFVGGNHEASNYLWELYYGGWVAPNIYYLGAANVIRLGPLRIAALSGIWKGYNYRKPHYERLPFNEDDIKSIYHIRELDTRKLLQLQTQVDVGISHDWPQGIEWKGNYQQLFRKKKDFEADARDGRLGSVAAKLVLDRLRPAYWFSAHLHIKYSATVMFHSNTGSTHQQVEGMNLTSDTEPLTVPANTDEIDLHMDEDHGDAVAGNRLQKQPLRNDAEIDLDMGDEEEGPVKHEQEPEVSDRAKGTEQAAVLDSGQDNIEDASHSSGMMASDIPADIRAQLPAAFSSRTEAPQINQKSMEPPAEIRNSTTRFLALDKCLPRRDFLQLMEIAPLNEGKLERPLDLEYDKEWLGIVRVFADKLIVGDPSASVAPDEGQEFYRPLIATEEAWVEQNLVRTEKMSVPHNFERTAPIFDPAQGTRVKGQPREFSNPQTKAFCELLQIVNPFHATDEEILARAEAGPRPNSARADGGGRWRGSSRGGFRKRSR